MAASFGEQLRLAREARGISLREISEQTRISMRYLEAIEASDFKRLPGGIFNRSFIKSYARYIGYDEKDVMESYTRAMREQGDTSEETSGLPHKPHVYTDGHSTRSPLVTLLLTILILTILSLGVYAVLHWYQRRERVRTAANPAPAASDQRTQPAPQQTGASPSSAAAPATASTQTGTAPTAADGFNIQLKAREQVWVRVFTDEPAPKSAFAGNLQPDETKEFTPERSLRVQCSKDKAEAISIIINGRPARVPFNMKGSLAEMTVTKEDYEQFLQ
ncbi:MAG TPA: helix-turn-helix domain-containing protein [Pyrinomonadaceae bacterium]|jgi:cytoskeleton protein RodZ|nr:helix-turn-helix domain-containing protein [Pyrinomonadaceae bacterium]